MDTPRRQRGAMAITMALLLVGLISMLGLVEVGYLFWAKRNTQKVADLAALSGVQQLGSDCIKAYNAAYGNATNGNRFPTSASSSSLSITCGSWSPAIPGTEHFIASARTSAQPNAVKVIASRAITPFFKVTKSLPNVGATAIATTTQPIAVFSVGSTLLKAGEPSTLEDLLHGIGIPLSGSDIAGYDGLANVFVTPSGLLKQLGIPLTSITTVGSFNELLAAHDVSLGELLSAVATVAGQDVAANAKAHLLSAIDTAIDVDEFPLNPITLGGDDGLFATIVAPDEATESALNAQVNALQVIATAIGIATSRHAITVSDTSVSLGSLLSATVQASIVEPPSIGIGGIGTTAHTSQVRLFVHITADTNNDSLLGALLGSLVSIKINLPIATNVVNASAKLKDLCSEGVHHDDAQIMVHSSILDACVGNIDETNILSTTGRGGCSSIFESEENPDTTLISAKLSLLGILGLTSVNLTTHLQTSVLGGDSEPQWFKQGDPPKDFGNPLAIGTAVTNVVDALAGAVTGNTHLLDIVTNILTSPLNLLGSDTLKPLLENTLGLKLGVSTVHLQSLQCHRTKLVY